VAWPSARHPGAPTNCLRTEEPVRRVVETDQRPLEVVNGMQSQRSARLDRCAVLDLRHFLELIDELNHLNIEFVSFRENIDTDGALGRAMIVIVGAITELERNLIVERVRAGMRRAKLEGRRIGRTPLPIDRAAVVRDRRRGLSLTEVAKAHGISRALVSRIMRDENAAGHEGFPEPSQIQENGRPGSVA
jgi:DNA invertase Pin-like site-specific DNA recombinase